MTRLITTRRMMAASALFVLLTAISFAQTVPNGAIKEANKIFESRMERAKADPERFRQSWNIPEEIDQVSAAVLQDPYIYFMMDEENIADFAQSHDASVLSHAWVWCYGFPMTVKGEHIGTILVAHNMDKHGQARHEHMGEWIRVGGLAGGDPIDRRIRELRKEYPEDRGYVVCPLKTLRMGSYILIRREGMTERITAVTRVAGKVLMLEEGRKRREYPTIPYERALPLLREKAIEHVRRLEEYRRNYEQRD